MFTGIIEEIGTVRRVSDGRLELSVKKVLEGTKVGDSIAVNGVCLTVTSLDGTGFTADVMPETLRRSNLGSLKSGDRVNTERAMAADGRFGGHIVSGHIDGTGTIVSVRKDDNALWYDISAGSKIMRYIVEKGSVTIDGISLTVAKVSADVFSVSAMFIFPRAASAYFLARVCLFPAEEYFALLYSFSNVFSPSISYTSKNHFTSKQPPLSSSFVRGVYFAIMASRLLSMVSAV